MNYSNNVIISYTSDPDLYPIKDEIEDHTIDVERILSIGLLTNEIVSNIIKYAYDPKTGGDIIVRFKADDVAYEFEIGDKGKGLPKKKENSLGLTLIDLLVQQINGTLETEYDLGVCYKITIPIDEGNAA